MSTDMKGNPYYKADYKGSLAIVIGNEGNGISEKVKKQCDFSVSIPVHGEIESFIVFGSSSDHFCRGCQTAISMKTILIVDGYNVIHGSDDLKRLSEIQLEEARVQLINDEMATVASAIWETILVFDAYQQQSLEKREEMVGRIKVVFTEKNKTADSYIEKLVYSLAVLTASGW